MVPATILELSRYRWNLPMIERLQQAPSVSFVELAEGLAASRDAIRRSLACLTGQAWVLRRREAGPRYLLSKTGLRLAPSCVTLLEAARTQEVQPLALRRWTLPVASALGGWELRFAELKVLLPGITARALVMVLKDMQEGGLVSREVVGGFPPSAVYRLTGAGARFLPALETLSRAKS